MATVTYHAREATFKYLSAWTVVTSTTLESQFASGSSLGTIKNLTIKPPMGDVDLVNYLGEDANGLQNQELEMKAYDMAELSGTLAMDSGETLQTLAYGAGSSSASGYTRYRPGDGSRNTAGAFLILLDNGTDEFAVAMDNLIITKLGDIKPTGADGHWEMDFEAKCLATDYYEEFKD